MFKAIILGETPLAEEQYYQQVKNFGNFIRLPIKKTEEHRNYGIRYNLIEEFKKNKVFLL